MFVAPSAPCGPLTASFVSSSLVLSRSPGTCSSLGLRDLGLLLDDRRGSASLATACSPSTARLVES